MKTLTQTALATLALLLPATLYARLGESGDEIAKRFGSEVKVHPQYSNASMAIYELGRALYFSMSAETSKMMDVLSNWGWERVTFRGYVFGEFKVYVILLDDKSVFEHYSRAAMLSDKEMETLLSANSGGGKWQQRVNTQDPVSSIRKWVIMDPTTKKPTRMAITDDGSNLSLYLPAIALYCAEAAQSIVSQSEAKRKGTIKGF
jgi:hypothetical protein